MAEAPVEVPGEVVAEADEVEPVVGAVLEAVAEVEEVDFPTMPVDSTNE